VLADLLVDDTPHPLGSEAQEGVRERLVAALREAGAEPEVRRAFTCSPLGSCGWTQNVVVHLPGRRDSAVLYSCHTDSAPSSPGAGDDGAAVAIGVELVRHWVTRDHENSLLFLFDEGEEVGLLGALAFLETDPRAAQVAAAVNLEARGTSGISQLFETSPDSAWMVAAWADRASYPFANTLSDLVYDIMPHYTDLTVWEWFGIPAVNFAFAEDAHHYHSAGDTLENLDLSALQSHGQNAWDMLEVLADADLDHAPLGDDAYFDVLGLAVIHWPVRWTPWLALAVLGAAVATCWRRRETLALRSVARVWGSWLGTLAFASLWAGAWVAVAQALSGAAEPWAAHPLPLTLGVAIGTLAIVAAWAPVTRSVDAVFAPVLALALALIGAGLSVFAPAAAYLFMVPAAAALLGGRADARVAALAGLAVSVLLWFPVIYGLQVALGLGIAVGLALAGAMSLGFAMPLLAEVPGRVAAGALLLAGLSAGITVALPPFSEARPERVWDRDVLTDAPPPSVDDLELRAREEGWEVTGRIRSRRGASELILATTSASGLDSLRIEGVPVRDTGGVVAVYGVPSEGVRFEAHLEDPSVPWRISDRTYREQAPTDPLQVVSWTGFEAWTTTQTSLVPLAGRWP